MTDRTRPLTAEDSMKAAEYALGVLQGKQREAFGRRLQAELHLAAAVRQWDESFASFAEDIAPVEPPAHVQVALERRLFVSHANSDGASLWNSLWFWRGLAVASLVGLLAFGTWNLGQLRLAPSSGLVAQLSGETNAVGLVAYYDEPKGQLRLNRTRGTPPSGRSFELWLIAGNDAPISLGVLPRDATGIVTVPAKLRSKINGSTLAISDEPEGGSPTGAPTGAVLATGTLTAV